MAGTSQGNDVEGAVRWPAGLLVVVVALVVVSACAADEPAGGVELDPSLGADSGCDTPDPAALADGKINSGGDVRSFEIDLPPGDLAEPRPLVLNIHGAVSSAELLRRSSGLPDLAEREGFVLVSPDASYRGDDDGTWILSRAGKDVAFLYDLLDEVQAHVCIDPQRVYATGFSQGGILSLILGCDQPERFAAVAPVAGMIDVEPCASDEPISVFAVHGTADSAVGYDGRVMPFLTHYVEGPSVPELAARFARRNGCTDATAVDPGPGPIDRHRYDCPGGVVELVTVVGGRHAWPGSRRGFLSPPTTAATDFNATEEIWRFFADQARPD